MWNVGVVRRQKSKVVIRVLAYLACDELDDLEVRNQIIFKNTFKEEEFGGGN